MGHQYDRHRHHRRSIRLPGYDYGQPGAYFVTICTYRRSCVLGGIHDGRMRLSECGRIVTDCWNDLERHYPDVSLESFVVMPNHIHGIILLDHNPDSGTRATAAQGAGLKPAPTTVHGLSEVVRAFKTFSSRRINKTRRSPGVPAWQRNYYERIMRDENELNTVRQYILDHPQRWHEDPENPRNRLPT